MSASETRIEQSPIILDVHDLRAGYGSVPVLHGVSFSLHQGEALGVVGTTAWANRRCSKR